MLKGSLCVLSQIQTFFCFPRLVTEHESYNQLWKHDGRLNLFANIKALMMISMIFQTERIVLAFLKQHKQEVKYCNLNHQVNCFLDMVFGVFLSFLIFFFNK